MHLIQSINKCFCSLHIGINHQTALQVLNPCKGGRCRFWRTLKLSQVCSILSTKPLLLQHTQHLCLLTLHIFQRDKLVLSSLRRPRRFILPGPRSGSQHISENTWRLSAHKWGGGGGNPLTFHFFRGTTSGSSGANLREAGSLSGPPKLCKKEAICKGLWKHCQLSLYYSCHVGLGKLLEIWGAGWSLGKEGDATPQRRDATESPPPPKLALPPRK